MANKNKKTDGPTKNARYKAWLPKFQAQVRKIQKEGGHFGRPASKSKKAA